MSKKGIPNIEAARRGPALRYRKLVPYFEKAMAAAAIGAEKPTTREIHPERNATALPKLSLRKTYSPPDLEKAAPSSP